MKIQINTDSNIDGNEAFAAQVSEIMEHALKRFQAQITRLEVHLSDENGDKNGRLDKRCVIEARLEGKSPIVASDSAATTLQAAQQASDKLARMMDGAP